jgi:hypothetical protein
MAGKRSSLNSLRVKPNLMALGDYRAYTVTLILVMLMSILLPVAFIYAVLYMRIYVWPLIFGYPILGYLIAEHFDKRKPRRRWKFWEPKRNPLRER